MKIRVKENKTKWLVTLNGRIAARFSKALYTRSAAEIYAVGLLMSRSTAPPQLSSEA